MVLLVQEKPSQMETLLGRFGLDRMALEILGNTEVENFLLFVTGSRLSGQNKRNADIDMHGIYVPPAHELTGFDIQSKIVEHKFEMPTESGMVTVPVSVTLMPVQRAMKNAYDLEGNVWMKMATIARHSTDWLVHEPINRDGGYNLLHMFEDTAVRMVPHLPKFALETHYFGMAKSYRAQINKELKANDPERLIKLVDRFYHVIAMWRDSRVQWPVGMTDWNALKNLDHAVPLDTFKRHEACLTKERVELLADIDAELELLNGTQDDRKSRVPDPVEVEKFRTNFKKLVAPALRRLYQV